uniref:Ribosomal l1 domain-containing protein n=1 Tax=Elaeophora elaphi TaxID=1147741 RepID=A0A0R3RR58_9BILA
MKHLVASEDSPEQDLEPNISSDGDCGKNIQVNKNDVAEVSTALAQIEQKHANNTWMKLQTREAVNVLIKVSEKNEKKMLFPEIDQLLHIQFVYKKPGTTPTGRRVKRFILPHPLYEKGNTTVCLIMRDLDQSAKGKFDPDVDKQARLWSEKLELEFGVTKEHVQKILTKRQLEREYHSYYDRRQLASAFDIFLVDIVIEESVIRFCGKEFHKAKKIPVRLRMHRHRSLIKEIEKAYYTVTFPLFPFRTRTSLRIGNLSNPIDHIVENVRAAVENVFQYCPGGLCNIHSVSLQMVTGGPSLPLYVDAGPRNAISLPKPMKMKDLKAKRDEKAIADELSTLPEGLEVLVYGDGEVKVLDSDTKKPVLYPTVNDEWEERDDLKPLVDPIKQKETLEKRRRLREKRKKAREAKKRLLLPVKDSVSKMKGLVKKKNYKRNKINGSGGIKRKGQAGINEKSKLHRSVKAKKKMKEKGIKYSALTTEAM